MTRLFGLAFALALLPPSAAVAQDAGTMFAPIMRTERAGGGVVRVVYDLRGVSGTAFAVSLEASDDGGQTYTVRPRAVTGDVGARVSPGAEKTIVWDSSKDVDDLQVDRYVFRVRVSTTGPNADVVATAPAGRGTGNVGPTGTAVKKGGLGKSAIVGILGGAAAAGIGVAASKGSTSGNPSNGTSPPPLGVVTSAVIDVTPPSGAGIRAVTNYSFAGSAPNLTQGTFGWDFGDGVTGSGATTTHVYGSDGSFRVTLTITAGSVQVMGSSTVIVGNVTSTWVHGAGFDPGEVTLSMVQQGTTVAGQWRHKSGNGLINTVPFHGTLSSPRNIQLVEDGECLAIVSGTGNA